MFKIPTLAGSLPTSVQDALSQAEMLFKLAGLNEATVSLTRPPEAGEILRGACLEASVPVRSLELLAGKMLDSMAASQGVKVAGTRLSLRNGAPGPLSLEFGVEVDVRIFGKPVTVGVRGVADGSEGESVVVRQLQLDPGSGMFAGMATALLRTRLDALEGRRFDLTEIARIPVRLERLECSGSPQQTLRVGLRFE